MAINFRLNCIKHSVPLYYFTVYNIVMFIMTAVVYTAVVITVVVSLSISS